jgi:hypothetical protein
LLADRAQSALNYREREPMMMGSGDFLSRKLHSIVALFALQNWVLLSKS